MASPATMLVLCLRTTTMSAVKIVVAESIADAGLELLAAYAQVDLATEADHEELTRRLREADALVVRSATQVDARMIGASPKLRVIGRAGIGV
ncbi:MAG TPA: hypothetical protein ENG94_07990, partial [Actinobacteria bacterium]|nr:hypothetical protein [Actinomycetota bacterium]